MKVLHVETGRHLYGGALQVRYLLEGLKRSGVENFLNCPRESEIASVARPFATVFEASMAGDLDIRFLVSLIRYIRKTRPDLVHVHSRRGADLWGPLAARVCRVPAIVTRRVDNPESPLWVRWKYRRYEKVITISEGIRRVLLHEGLPTEKTVCVPSAVDVESFGQPCERTVLKREFGLSPDARTIGVIAQLIERKGHRYLIEAAPVILRAFPRTRFIFFGKGPMREDLARLCEEQGISDKVVFAGFRKDLQRILPCLDLVVHPALMEGLGVSLLQASASGVPIVAFRAGGIPEIVQDGVNGYLLPPKDVRALGLRITEILSNASLARQMGEEGRRIVETRFSIVAMVRGNLEVYREITGEGQG